MTGNPSHATMMRALCFVALILASPPLPLTAQTITEVTTDGWGRGFDQAAPFIADLDGNGRLDLLVGASWGNIAHYEQSAAGSLQFDRITYSFLDTVVSSQPSITSADIDGDGLLDLLIGGNSGLIYHYEQEQAGSANYRGRNRDFLGVALGAHSVPFLTDLEGDGLLDLLITESTGKSYHYRQQSSGSETFVTGKADLLPHFNPYPSLYLGDIDGDGALDLLVGDNSKRIKHYTQAPTRKDTFLLLTDTFNNLTDIQHCSAYIYDIDGDGRLEMLTGDQQGQVIMYRQAAAGSMDFGIPVDSAFLKNRDFGTNSSFAVTDLDGDGLLDLLVAALGYQPAEEGRIFHLEQTAPGSLRFDIVTDRFNNIVTDAWPGIGIHDIDGNGRLDMLIGDGNSRIKRYEQTSPASLEFVLVNPLFNGNLDLPGNRAWPVFADLEENGRLDMLIGASGGRIHHFEQNSPGDSLFTEISSSFSGIERSLYPAFCLMRGQYSRLLLLLLGGRDGKIGRYLQDQSDPRKFSDLGFMKELRIEGNSQPASADVNGDGALDIFVGDQAGGISLFLGPAPVNADLPEAPSQLELEAVYPQPAAGTVNLLVNAHGGGRARLELSDMLGRVVAVLADRIFPGGSENVNCDLSGVPAGCYIIRAAGTGIAFHSKLIVAP